jgi:hypothetical protein
MFTPAYVNIRQHTSAHSAYASLDTHNIFTNLYRFHAVKVIQYIIIIL